jgi:hypothetical protein
LHIANIDNYWEKPLFAIPWQKVLTPKTLAYCQYWQLLGKAPFRHSVAKGANPQNACILPILTIIGKVIGKTNSPLLCRIIAILFYKIILYNGNLSLILLQIGNYGGCNYGGCNYGGCNYRGCNYGAARAWGGKGGSALPPQKSDLFYLNKVNKTKNE